MMSNESSSEPQWAAYVAIDCADREHVWKMQPAGNGPCESGKVEQTPEALEIWDSQLATRFNERPIAVALEQSRGPLVFSLTKYGHLHLFPVHLSMLAHFREAMVPSEAKNDPGDTGLLLELLVQYRSRPPASAAGHRTDARVAISGRESARPGRRQDILFEPADRAA